MNKTQYKIQTLIEDINGIRWVNEDELPWLSSDDAIEQCKRLQYNYKDIKFRVVKEEVIYV